MSFNCKAWDLQSPAGKGHISSLTKKMSLSGNLWAGGREAAKVKGGCRVSPGPPASGGAAGVGSRSRQTGGSTDCDGAWELVSRQIHPAAHVRMPPRPIALLAPVAKRQCGGR